MKTVLKLLAVTAGVLLGVGVFRHPVFAVAEASVSGLSRLSEADVLEQAPVLGQNLLALPVHDVTESLMQNPWVREVQLQRHLPNRVAFFIEERKPAAVWEAGRRFFLVDRDGTVLEETRSPRDLPVIKDLDGPVPQPGDRRDADAVTLAATLVQRLPADLGLNPRAFEYLSYGGLVVEVEGGRRARFGDSSDLDWKLAVWRSLLDAAAGSRRLNVGHVDLRFGDRPFFRP